MKRVIILSQYELVIIPCNHMMEPISKSDYKIIKLAGLEEINNYLKDKYKINDGGKIKDGDIRIIPGFNIKPDIMFVKFPFRTDDDSIELFKKTITDMYEIKRQNGYESTLFPNYDPLDYGYTVVEMMEILRHRIQENKKYKEQLTKN